MRKLEKLSTSQILQWADAHQRRTGQWPVVRSGKVRGSAGETWTGINQSLTYGFRGLPGGVSLAKLLERRRGIPVYNQPPKLTVEMILAWAIEHRRRTGAWPAIRSGPIRKAPGENWKRIDGALRNGSRGLRPGSSLAKLINKRRDKRHSPVTWQVRGKKRSKQSGRT